MTREDALNRLREWFPKGSTVYLVRRSTSRTGDTWTVGVLAFRGLMDQDRAPDLRRPVFLHPNVAASVALGVKLVEPRWDAIRWGRRQMYSVGQSLGLALYGDPQALKEEWL